MVFGFKFLVVVIKIVCCWRFMVFNWVVIDGIFLMEIVEIIIFVLVIMDFRFCGDW